jgi:serine/threonine protein phosphatase PrpC
MKLILSAVSDIGCVRTNNEDMVLVKDEFVRDGVFTGELETGDDPFFVAVSDGMGGHNAGELASEFVLHRMAAVASELGSDPAELRPRQLDGPIQEIHASLNAMGTRDPAVAGLGCTFTGVLFRGPKVYSVHIGDSRLYRLRGPFLSQLTRDHTVANMLGTNSAPRNQIVNSFGGGAAGIFFDFEDLTDRVMPGDRLLLCSDGLTGEVTDEQMSRALSEGAGTGDLAEAAKAAGGRDNVSCVLIQLQIFLCLLLSLVMGRAEAQGTTQMSLCDMAARAGRTAAEKAEIRKDYALMLGITEDLGRYRQEFLDSAKLIDLFPTAYYHTTRNEMARIANGNYVYPIEKLKQLIGFYNAYKRNRVAWDQGNKAQVETHWATSFELSEEWHARYLSGYVLASAIVAHVQCDLGRAIRYAYVHRFNQAITPTDVNLLNDFNQTDAIFSTSKARTFEDIKYAFNNISDFTPAPVDFAETWVMTGAVNLFDGALVQGSNWAYQKLANACNFIVNKNFAFTDKDVVLMRKDAWRKAFSGEILKDFQGNTLRPQPDYPTDANSLEGLSICGVRTYKVQVSATTEEPQTFAIPINAGDEVMVLAAGTVHIGAYMGDADGKGLLNSHLTAGLYTKYKHGQLGCLTALQGNGTAVCGKLDPLGYCVADHFGLSISPDNLKADQYLSGLTFRATATGPISFDVNDTVKGDNGGAFTVYVFVRHAYAYADPDITDIK